jgi:MFS family permease
LSARPGFHESLAVLRIRDFRFFLLSRFCATLASQMQALVVSWQIYQLTKDALALGLVGLIEAVVFITFSFFAGHFADKREKRRIVLFAQTALFLCALTLMTLSRDKAQVWTIYSVIALTGLARSFLWPASFSYSELTVPRAIYSRAAAWNATGWEIGSILGPAIGGALYAWKGPGTAYAVVAMLAVLGIGFALLMGQRPPVIATPEEPHDLLSGARFVWSHRILLAAMSLDMFAVLFGGAVAILPIFADLYGVGPRGLGWLRAAPSIGAILMATYQQYRPPFQRTGRAILSAVVGFGLATIAFALSRSYWFSLVALSLVGEIGRAHV